VQAPGGVGQHEVGVAGGGGLDRVEMPSCSAAAARNVSPAAITTLLPSATSRVPSLPMVVVLPTPLTPTNSQTVGLSAEKARSRS
jgi:hypothetical protein